MNNEMLEGLTAERTEQGVKFTKTLEDGTKHSATLYVFDAETIARLRACVPTPREGWWARVRKCVSAAKPLGSGVIAEPSEQRGAKHSDPNLSEGDAQKQEP